MVLSFNAALAKPNKVRISGSRQLIDLYEEAVKRAGHCSKFESYDKPGFNHRGFIDLTIICRALSAAEYQFELVFMETAAYKRAIKNTASGRIDIMSELVWLNDIDAREFYVSDAVIRAREFEKGIFVLPGHSLTKRDAGGIDFSRYTGITKKQWQEDWRVLSQITPHMVNASSFQSMFRMMQHKRADFSLFNFTSEGDMSIEAEGVKLVPLKGVKVQFASARHFIVSRKSERSKSLFSALNEGISILRRRGDIQRVYQKSGFFHKAVEHWRVLNP